MIPLCFSLLCMSQQLMLPIIKNNKRIKTCVITDILNCGLFSLMELTKIEMGDRVLQSIISYIHTCMQILLQLLELTCTWQSSQDAYVLNRHCELCKQSSWSLARSSQENRPFFTASGSGHLKSHLDHCCFIHTCTHTLISIYLCRYSCRWKSL